MKCNAKMEWHTDERMMSQWKCRQPQELWHLLNYKLIQNTLLHMWIEPIFIDSILFWCCIFQFKTESMHWFVGWISFLHFSPYFDTNSFNLLENLHICLSIDKNCSSFLGILQLNECALYSYVMTFILSNTCITIIMLIGTISFANMPSEVYVIHSISRIQSKNHFIFLST